MIDKHLNTGLHNSEITFSPYLNRDIVPSISHISFILGRGKGVHHYLIKKTTHWKKEWRPRRDLKIVLKNNKLIQIQEKSNWMFL
jgi:hypothetical protein